MECAYCGFCSPVWKFCDDSCLKAYNRDLQRQFLTEKIQKIKDAHIKSDMDEWTKLIVRLFQLERLFYQGCLKRQTKQQLQLLLQRLKDHAQVMFVYADEHKQEFSDGDYLITARCCGEEYQKKYEKLCRSWCSP